MSKAIPDGFGTVTPHLVVKDCLSAIEFYKKAFGAKVKRLNLTPDKKMVVHADLEIGNSIVMMNDDFRGTASAPSPSSNSTLHIFVEDVDAWWKRAVDAGATVKMPLADQFWGDRYGTVADPYGHNWSLASHVADPTQEEMQEAMKGLFAQA